MRGGRQEAKEVKHMFLISALLVATCVTWGTAIWASFKEDDHETK